MNDAQWAVVGNCVGGNGPDYLVSTTFLGAILDVWVQPFSPVTSTVSMGLTTELCQNLYVNQWRFFGNTDTIQVPAFGVGVGGYGTSSSPCNLGRGALCEWSVLVTTTPGTTVTLPSLTTTSTTSTIPGPVATQTTVSTYTTGYGATLTTTRSSVVLTTTGSTDLTEFTTTISSLTSTSLTTTTTTFTYFQTLFVTGTQTVLTIVTATSTATQGTVTVSSVATDTFCSLRSPID